MKRTLKFVSVLLLVACLFASCAKSASGYDQINRYPSAGDVGMSANSKDPTFDYDSSEKPSEGEYERKIIYTSNITAETKEFDTALAKIESMVREFDGYVQSSSTTGNRYLSGGGKYNNARVATYTIRVPAENTRKFWQNSASLST